MKWGVKKARTGNLDRHAKPLERVAAGTGGKRDKVYASLHTPLKGIAKQGLRKAAGAEAAKSRAEIKRLSTGKSTAGDILRAYGSVTLTQIVGSTRTKSDFVPNKG
jgi:hypothetical protein